MRGSFVLAAALLAAALTARAADAATVIRLTAEGSAYVRVGEAPAVIVPAHCVRALEAGLAGQTDPAAVEAAVARIVRDCAAADPAVAAAIAAYAMTLVGPDLAPAVIAGAQAGNPDAADEIEVAAGPTGTGGPAPQVSTLTPLGGLRGIGGAGTQELRRGGSPTTF